MERRESSGESDDTGIGKRVRIQVWERQTGVCE